MGNNGVSHISVIDDVVIHTSEGSEWILREVRYVLDLKLNLISAGKLDEEGYNSQFGEGQWKLCRWSLVIAKWKRCCTLYRM